MGWKDWPYWLRGGIIGILIIFLLYSILYIFMFLRGFFFYGEGFANFLPYITDLIAVTLKLGSIAFIIGALIGWIVGKIKSKQ